MARKAGSKPPSLFWRIVISVIGICLILMSVANLLLFFFGETASANITTRRQGGSNSGAAPNQRYSWSVDYTFRAEDGSLHEGHTTRRGSDYAVSASDTVYYFPTAPFINSLEDSAEPNVGQPVMAGLGILLLVVMNRKLGRSGHWTRT